MPLTLGRAIELLLSTSCVKSGCLSFRTVRATRVDPDQAGSEAGGGGGKEAPATGEPGSCVVKNNGLDTSQVQEKNQGVRPEDSARQDAIRAPR